MYNSYNSYYSSYSSPYYSSHYNPSTETAAAAASGIAAVFGIGIVIMTIIAIALAVITLIGRWKVFKKANIPAWESLIPIHADIVELQLGGVQTYWWFLIAIFGIGPLIVAFWKNIALAKAFGKGTGFGVLLTFFPFVCYPLLGFGKAEYVGPQSK